MVWEGELPAARTLALPREWEERNPGDAEFCRRCIQEGKLVQEDLLIDPEGRGVANVAISLRGITEAWPGLAPGLLTNEHGRFHPRVQFVPVGQALRVVNKDPIPHNARIQGSADLEVWNGLLAPESESSTRPFLRSGSYRVFCDLHPWMSSTVIAVRHPFVGITDARGKLDLAGLPERKSAEFVLWHERLGTASKTIELLADRPVSLTVKSSDFAAPK